MIKDASNAEYHAFYDQLSSGIFLIRADEKEEIVFANRAALEIYDCESFEELRNLTAGVFRGMIRPESYRPLKVLIQKGAPFTKLYYEFFSAKKHFRMAEGTLSCISGDLESPLYLLQLYSINGRMESYSTDFTGLLSPQDLCHKAYSAARKNQKNGKFADFVPVYFDIANFSTYNRSFGIQQGDLCIKKVADTLKEVFPDGLLGHLSADNFAAILPRENLESKIQKICSDIDRYIDNRGISLKAGILVLPENASPDEIRHSFDRAKLACESVKNNMTRSFAFYMPGMEENFERRLYILKNFDRALDEGHIKVYYQPVVRTLSGKLCSYEALARWEDPKFGFISPAVFVPTLENARLIGRLDAFMIDNVCRLIRDRLSNGY